MKEINSYGFNMAADDTREVRIEERLKIKIGEAKNLPARGHGAPSHRDTYCVLSLDQEEIFRTSTMERTLNPFFGEEFQFEVPRRFRYLSIYVFDRDKHLKQDKVLGKVAIKREDLQAYNNKDHWFALRPVDADSEVQGKAHIEIMFEDSKTGGEEYQKEVNFVYNYQDNKTTEAAENEQQHMHTQYMRSSKQDLRIAEELAGSMSVERKSKVKNFSKNISEYCKESMKFGSCSSSTSKKLLSAAGMNESSVGLSRSESLKNHYQSYQNQGSHGYGSVSGQRGKCYMHPVPQGGQSPDSETSGMGSNESNHYSSDPERHYVNLEGSKPREVVDLKNKFSVRVLECSELTTKNGQCDPYALVTVLYANGKKVEKRTKVRKKTVNPHFDECFVFDLTMECDAKEREKDAYATWCGAEACETRVSLWHEAAAPAFLGEVRVQMRAPRHPLSNDAWYFLTSRSSSSRSRGATPPGTRLSAAGSASALGSLRLLLQYTVDRVFPLRAYDRLDALFVRSVQCKPITASAVYILGQIVSSKTDAAQPLVRLFTHHNLIVPVVRALADAEISALTDATTIFRGNTLVSKMMDECMRLSGAAYLRSVLRPTLAAVLADRRPCEIDPARVKERGAVEVNLTNLKEYVEQVFAAITSSYGQCPPAMCRLFDALRQCAAKHFPRNAEVRYSVVSGFIFLRFFAPAILGPRLFDLTTEQIDPQTNRTLTLISKTIQSLGNLVSSRSAQQVCKEEYMAALYRSFCTERHVQAIKRFLEIISTGSDTLNNNVQDTPVLLKEGTMIKRTETGAWAGTGAAGGRRRWSRVAGAAGAAGGKRRHFRLTSGELSWSRSRGKLPLRKLALDGVVAVAPVDAPPGTAPLGAANIFQIVHRDRTLYVQAGNCVERAEWLRLLAALCRQRHHPGPFQSDKWVCCGASTTEAGGCEGAGEPAAAACASLALRLDPARDLQRLHCLLYAHLQQIEERLHEAARAGDATTEVKTLKELREAVFTLEHQHRVYQRSLARETKYGSKQAPIGDDNYLHLAATSAMGLDGHQLPPFKPFQVAIITSPSLTRDTSALHHLQPAELHREPAIEPKRITDLERKFNEQFNPKLADLPFDPATDAKRNIDFDHKCKADAARDTVIYENRLADFERNEQFLKNSLYIGSSTESLKISGRNIDERLSGKSNKSGSSSSGYLKMSCLKNEHSEDSDTSGGKPSCPPRNANMKPALSENRLQVLPQQKPMCEYVDIKPKLPERQPKSKNVVKLSAKPKIPSNEEIADNPQFYCKEYELMSNFMSCAAKQRQQMNEDVPPVVPPRSHHLNSNSPSNRRFSSNVENLKLVSDSKEKKPDIDGRRSSLREHKSMEQYQLKLVEDIDGNKGNNLTNVAADSPIANSPPSLKEELRSQVKCDTEFEKSFTENALKESYCVLKVDSEDDKPMSRVQSEDKLVKEEVVPVSDEKKEEYGIFSRKSIQRKSNPIKSQNNSHKGLKSSSSTSNVKDICSQSKSSQLTERLTPFFFKKKTKPIDTAGQAPAKSTKKEDNLIGRLTPRFGQSRLYGRGQSLDLNVKCLDEKKGVERSATSVNIPVRAINSSLVGSLKFLSLHRPEVTENAVQCNKFVNRDSMNDMLDRNANEGGRDEPDCPIANTNADNVNSVNSYDGSDSEATSNDIIAENVADINYKNKVLEYVFENDVNFDKFSESIVILRDKHRVGGTEAARLSLTRSHERSDSQFIDNNLNISSATQPFLATSTSDIRL